MTDKTKYIVVLGGNVSGLGKGLIAASIAANLDWLGYKVKYMKCDPYYNVDPGTMAPTEHGECFVTEDGLETDMDLGHFERFTGQLTNRKSSLTSGMVMKSVLSKERDGTYLGKTVQAVPHITNEIISGIKDTNCDFKIVEVGGTVGDFESNVFLEAIRQLKRKENVVVVELVYVPWLACSKEWKTKLAQQAAAQTKQLGIEPDILLARSEKKLPQSVLNKIERLTDIPTALAEDLDNVYKIPLNLWNRKIIHKVLEPLGIDVNGEGEEDNQHYIHWKNRVGTRTAKTVDVAIAGKYSNGEESYKSIIEALYHAGTELGIKVNVDYKGEEDVEDMEQAFDDVDGLIVPGGFGKRGIQEKMLALKHARENNIPTLGICYGMQLMTVEYATNVLGIDAYSEEWGKLKGVPVISYMPGQKKSAKGGTMRLGKTKSHVYEGMLKDIYGTDTVWERHRHRLEFLMTTYKDHFTSTDIKIGATSPLEDVDGERLIEAIYLDKHPFYLGVQYHPEFMSAFTNPHPLFVSFIKSCHNI
jgi:CTP synthase